MIAEREARGQLQAAMAPDVIKLLFITKAAIEQALSRPMAHFDSTVFVFTHETISASLKVDQLMS